ncbi:ABC transporter ATP-binding protein [Clostridium sp. MSJ-4]|uniref:ABC transporter ATP-binding protein n=1 Tax=Clostridium simiarum TaxID=2841506 RepID=A0ABS6EZE0_9CLOT|nr:ABC transporter ATP-binding protein [Clostridium simiarum]MBU5591586.1 ABC transporter ATP-binding protein [Clostridium simiarum]
MIQFENVTYSYSEKANNSLKNINLNIKKGEFIVLTGKSGCGKTTVTRIINGLSTKFFDGNLTGKVIINNEDLSKIPLWKVGQTVGSIFQDPRSQFFASITEDEIAFGCENYGFDKSTIHNRVDDSIQKIDGENLREKLLYPMSSGEKQKIAIASVYAVNPKIYVFDEPSANLDMYSVIKLKELMLFLKNSGHTIVVAEHRLYYLTDLADRFIYMDDGEIIREYTPAQIKSLDKDKVNSLGLRLTNLECPIPQDKICISNREPSIEIQSLRFSYGKTSIFSDLTIKAYPGDIIAIIGHNGVGKSTLSQILCGLMKEQSGCILYNGHKVRKNNRKKLAYFVMQNTDCQLFAQSVKEELMLNNSSNMSESQIEVTLKRYGLWEYRDKHPVCLSGGEKQRLTLAVGDMLNPNILILDEPTSGLDGENMRRISSHLKNLSKEKKTIFVITHDYEFAVSTCNRAIQLANGRCHMDFLINGNSSKLLSCMLEANLDAL